MTSGLHGARIWVSRPLADAVSLNAALTEAGATVVSAPLIEIVPIVQNHDDTAAQVFASDWVLVTSANAARFFCATVSLPEGTRPRVGALGAATADAVKAAGWPVDLIGDGTGAVALARLLVESGEVAEKNFFCPCSEIAPDSLKVALQKAGAANVIAYPCYRTIAPQAFDSRQIEGADMVILYSGSAARNLYTLSTDIPTLQRIPAVAIGETTAQQLATLRTADCQIAADPSVPAVVAAAVSLFQRTQKGSPS